ncbi:MAG: CYTH domain-containing protein [Bacteroidales bacterium]|nr:CYTH domain-containing protein [Bacteroidales bacterium]
MPVEIERKFLVQGDYKSLAVSHSRIRQGYICSSRGRTVRVRLRDDKGYLTIKGPSLNGGLSRYEFEKEISVDEALSLLCLCEPGMVDKIRWLVPVGKHVFEVDEFFGDNEGLVVAEVELAEETEDFERPAFLGMEVTGDRRYYNSSLRSNPYKKWDK